MLFKYTINLKSEVYSVKNPKRSPNQASSTYISISGMAYTLKSPQIFEIYLIFHTFDSLYKPRIVKKSYGTNFLISWTFMYLYSHETMII